MDEEKLVAATALDEACDDLGEDISFEVEAELLGTGLLDEDVLASNFLLVKIASPTHPEIGEWDGTVWLTEAMIAEHKAQPDPGWSEAHTKHLSGNLADFLGLADTPDGRDELLRVIISSCMEASGIA